MDKYIARFLRFFGTVRNFGSMKFFKTTLISGLVVVLCVAAFTGVFKYYQTASSPRQTVRVDGARVHVEELSFFDGMDKTYGKLYRPADDTLGKHPVIIFCHGISVNADWFDAYCRSAAAKGFYAYAFDFKGGSPTSRSTGLSTMKMTVDSEKEDLLFVLKRIRHESFTDKSKVFVAGHSLGGLVAALAAKESRRDIAGLILLSPAFNIVDMAQEFYPKLRQVKDTTDLLGTPLGKKFFTELRGFDPYKWLPRYQRPVLLIEGENDNTVPPAYVEKAFEQFGTAEYELIPKTGHTFKGADADVRRRVLDWLDRQL